MLDFLKGKKTIIGSLLLSLSGLVWGLDQITHSADAVHWFTVQQYEAFGVFVGGLTGVAMRLGMKADVNAAKPGTN